MNCGTVVKWYIDKDGDKWYDKNAAPIESQYVPQGGSFIRDPLGPDCDDNDATKTTDCDPCAQIKAQIANAAWIQKLNILKGKTALKYESGYLEQLDTQSPFLELAPEGDSSDNLNFPITKTTKGYMHVHTNPYTRIGNDGDEKYIQPIHMFSPADIIQMLKLTANAYQNQIPMPDVYGAMVSSTGTYQLKFTGDTNMLLQNLSNTTAAMNTYKNKIERVDDVYKKAIRRNKGNEGGLLDFMQTIFKINGLELFKIEDDNSVSKITKGTDGKVVKTPCTN